MSRAELEDEVEFVRRQRDRLVRNTQDALDFEHRAFLKAISEPDVVIRTPVDDDYLLPAHFAKTMSRQRLQELRALLSELKEFCAGLAGMLDVEAMVLNNGDETALLLRQAFTDLLLAHAKDRLGKPSVRDRNGFTKWLRLMDEFVWWYVDLTCAAGPGHRTVLGGTHNRVAWELFHATWEPQVEFDMLRGGVNLYDMDVDTQNLALSALRSFHWDSQWLAHDAISIVPEIGANAEGDLADLREELVVIADDLRAVKALLIRGHHAADRFVDLPGGWVARWSWQVGQRTGSVEFAEVVEHLREPLMDGSTVRLVSIGLDGRAIDSVLSWIDLGEDGVRFAVGLLRPIRDRLVADWLAVPRSTADVETTTAANDSVTEGEVVAASCEALFEPEVDDGDTDEVTKGSRYRHRVPAVREQALLNMMQSHFGCEVNNSKGSEVTVFRPGGKKYTLAAKRRGQHMPSFEIIKMLKRLGIPAAEFATVARKRA